MIPITHRSLCVSHGQAAPWCHEPLRIAGYFDHLGGGQLVYIPVYICPRCALAIEQRNGKLTRPISMDPRSARRHS